MSRLLLPTKDELLQLAEVRADICLSMYVDTSPLKLYKEQCRIELANQLRDALQALRDLQYDKRRVAALQARVEEIISPEKFCEEQANTLVLLATPDQAQIFRLANNISNFMEISDRFYLKPMFRALTFEHTAYVLAISENAVRLLELFPDCPPERVKVLDLPKSAQDALGLKHLRTSVREPEDSGQNIRRIRLLQYAKIIDDALQPLLLDNSIPVILAAADPLESIFRDNSKLPLTPEGINGNAEHLTDQELDSLARPILDQYFADQVQAIRHKFSEMTGLKRTLCDLADISVAATNGAVELALVDFEQAPTGYVDDQGYITYSDQEEAYGLVDEVVKRSLKNGARIMAIRNQDMPCASPVAAILRYPAV